MLTKKWLIHNLYFTTLNFLSSPFPFFPSSLLLNCFDPCFSLLTPPHPWVGEGLWRSWGATVGAIAVWRGLGKEVAGSRKGRRRIQEANLRKQNKTLREMDPTPMTDWSEWRWAKITNDPHTYNNQNYWPLKLPAS